MSPPARAPAGPPLRVWLLAAALVAAFAAWLGRHEIRALFPALGGPGTRIIALGDSSLRAATYSGEQMSRFAAELGAAPLHFVRVTGPGADLHAMLPRVEAAIAARPDAVLLHSWLVAHPLEDGTREVYRESRRRDARGPALGRAFLLVGGARSTPRYRTLVFDQLRALAGRGTSLVHVEPGAAERCTPERWEKALKRNRRRWPEGGMAEIKPRIRAAVERLLDRAAAADVRFVFVDVPRAQDIEALPGVREKRALTRRQIAAWVAEGRAEHLRNERPAPDADYCDGVHRTDSGRVDYSRWLLDGLGLGPDSDPGWEGAR